MERHSFSAKEYFQSPRPNKLLASLILNKGKRSFFIPLTQMLGKLPKYTAVLYAFLIFLGYSYTHFFYYQFNLEIFSFLEFSEILILFLANMIFVVIGIIIILLFLGIPFIVYTNFRREQTTEPTPPAEKKLSRRQRMITLIILSAQMIALLVYMVYSVYRDWKQAGYVSKYIKVIVLTMFVFGILYFLLPRGLKRLGISYNRTLANTILTVILICILNFMQAHLDSEEIKRNLARTNYTFIYEGKSFRNSDTSIYIGATSRYIFVHNPNNELNYVYNKDQLTNLAIGFVKVPVVNFGSNKRFSPVIKRWLKSHPGHKSCGTSKVYKRN